MRNLSQTLIGILREEITEYRRIVPWIISHFPAHRIYVEPFGGGSICAAA